MELVSKSLRSLSKLEYLDLNLSDNKVAEFNNLTNVKYISLII